MWEEEEEEDKEKREGNKPKSVRPLALVKERRKAKPATVLLAFAPPPLSSLLEMGFCHPQGRRGVGGGYDDAWSLLLAVSLPSLVSGSPDLDEKKMRVYILRFNGLLSHFFLATFSQSFATFGRHTEEALSF